MLETADRDGHARILTWSPSEGKTATTPLLIVPDTSRTALPDWAEVVLTSAARSDSGRAAIEIVSDGTWFHPAEEALPDGDDALVLRAPQPTTTGVIQTLTVGDDLAVWHDAGGWLSKPTQAVITLLEAKQQAGMGRLLWGPALGDPSSYALWTYLGIDAFDASPLQLAAVRGTALTTDGPLSHADALAVFGAAAEDLVAFNLDQARAELARIKQAIKSGTLRALVERRVAVHPNLVAVLRRFDSEHGHLESATPVHKSAHVACMTGDSLWMPEVERFRRRMRDDYQSPEMTDVLVLLPCSARKPYKISKTHRYFQRALDDSGIRHRCHEVMVTSPLGLVPREMEDIYPAGHYDVPVTGHWTRDEEAVIREQLAHLLMNHEYKHVVAHVSESTYTFLRDLLPDATLHTVHQRPSSIEDCARLLAALRRIKEEDPQPFDSRMWNQRKVQDLQSVASYQFGPAAAADLVADCKARGRPPYVKFEAAGVQRGQTTEKGLISLTLDGAELVAPHGAKRVHIGDFWPTKTGSLFAVGVDGADPDVRPGDCVVVMHGEEVRAVGQAHMSAAEMTGMKRGVAVVLRHIRKQPKKTAPVAVQEMA